MDHSFSVARAKVSHHPSRVPEAPISPFTTRGQWPWEGKSTPEERPQENLGLGEMRNMHGM